LEEQLSQLFESPMKIIGEVDKTFTYLLNRQIKKHGLDLTAEQCCVLFCLWKNDGLNQNEIAEQTYKDKTTISRHIHHLMEKGFVKRAILESDKRNRLIFLTKSGKELKSITLEIIKDVESKIYIGVSNDEQQVFMSILNRVICNLQTG